MSTISFETSLIREVPLVKGSLEDWEYIDEVMTHCKASMYRTFKDYNIYYGAVPELNAIIIIMSTNFFKKRVVMGLYMYDESDIELTPETNINKASIYLSRLDCVNRQVFRGTVSEIGAAIINFDSNPSSFYSFDIDYSDIVIKTVNLYETTLV